MSAEVKGWCPSAHRPMMSGDGLLVRIRPRLARLAADEVSRLCALADNFGNGMIDVTSRANLQIRGVTEAVYPALLAHLIEAGLVEADPKREACKPTVAPFWGEGERTERLAQALGAQAFPELPDKMGVVVDAGPAPVLTGISGDFRFETGEGGALILRADGATHGRAIPEDEATGALVEMIDWFLATGGAQAGRMAHHLTAAALPKAWQQTRPARSADRPEPGEAFGGYIAGVPFGQTDASALAELMSQSKATHLRVTPWRMFFLEGASMTDVAGFLTAPDPLLDVAACPGAPACAQASVETRALARRMVGKVSGALHVSGCSKGCARRAPAATTLVGRDGRFDLVQNGRASDTPAKHSLTEADVLELMG